MRRPFLFLVDCCTLRFIQTTDEQDAPVTRAISIAISSLLLATACSSGPTEKPEERTTEQAAAAEPTEPAAPTCPVQGADPVAIQLPSATGEALMVDGLEHDRIWNSDLNGDNMPDMILQQRGACNAEDECMTSIWVGCTPNTFARVWGTDFAYELYVLEETTTVDGAQWAVIERGIPPRGDDVGIGTERLVFDGQAYRAKE